LITDLPFIASDSTIVLLKRLPVILGYPLLILLLVFLPGYTAFQQKPFDEARYLTHAVTRADGDLTVTADILTREKTREFFGFDFIGNGIQPIWVKIENAGTEPCWFVPHRLDPEYYSAMEAANVAHGSRSTPTHQRIY
jgi:hypothetical protein